MPQFSYKAVTGDGTVSTGVVTAAARDMAIDIVMNKGLSPVAVDPIGDDGGSIDTGAPMPAASGRATEAFVRELGNLLTAGVSLTRSLDIIGRETAQAAAKRVWTDLRSRIADGSSLADAMAHHPRSFSAVQVAMVRAGEQGGFLDKVLAQIAEFRARERDLIGKVRTAMIYPAFLFVMLMGVMVFLLTYFIPQFRDIFDEFGESLPILTRIVLEISGGIRAYGLLVLFAVATATVLLRRAWITPSGRAAMDRATLAMPGIGRVAARFALVRFCRLLGTLLAAGVPLVAALRTARDALGNSLLKQTMEDAIEQVQSGSSLAASLRACTRLFPPSVVETIAIAEETGRVDSELVRVADYHERELDRALAQLVALLEPIMLLVMAGVVGTVVLSMLLPIFTLQDLIK